MLNDEKIVSVEPFSLPKREKERFFLNEIASLFRHHLDHCLEYRKIVRAMNGDDTSLDHIYDLPFIPVNLFKQHELRSVGKEDVVKTMTSSGTTGGKVSKIFLDKVTAANQVKALSSIVTSFLGKSRHPMIILDTSEVVKDRTLFSARGAGILGFSIFGKERLFAFDRDMNLDVEGIKQFLQKHKGKRLFLFGFTFMIWAFFYKLLRENSIDIDLSDGVLIHGGGWKKLKDESVSTSRFKKALNDVCGISKVYNYYGMVEQTGSVYIECDEGHLHASTFSEVIIRKHYDFTPALEGETGIIQTLSLLPFSYPGHSLLTEDEGYIAGEDNCPCGRKGKYISVLGRVKGAELKGCSDTYAGS